MLTLRSRRLSLLGLLAVVALLQPRTSAQAKTPPALEPALTPFHPSGIYDRGEKAGWTVTLADAAAAPAGKYSYSLKKNGLEIIRTGDLDLSSGKGTIEMALDEPAMLYLEVTPPGGDRADVVVAGAAIAPTKLQPVAPRPADFDAFWQAKIAELKSVPANPVLTPGDSGRPDVEYATIAMDNAAGAKIYGQIAKPKKPGKYPALLILQWASPPYPLQKSWVVDRAAEGWLALNVEPHEVLPTEPQKYYDELPDKIKRYESIGNDDRDKSYFLRMYLGDYRAVDYLASRPDWDGRTLCLFGVSMGGQQSLCVAGLHPQVTHMIVNVPAGCDLSGPLHGRAASYPNFPVNNPKVAATAPYFDAVNFAPNIKAQSLVAMGFVDTACAPAGIWTAFNKIAAPKEAAPMFDSPHNHLATPAQQRPFTERSTAWLGALVKGQPISPPSASKAQAASAPAFDDHRHMMEQLGVKSLRPGANPNNQAIFDERTASPYKDTMPDALTMKDGTKVTRPDQWPARRAEILEDFAREIYGRIPENVPPVVWEVTSVEKGESGGIPTITKHLMGHVDNSGYPAVKIDIQARFTVPAEGSAPRPIMIEFGGYGPFGNFRPRTGVPWTDQAIAHGWGYGFIGPGSIQPDNNNFRIGIIGLTNKGQPRAPDQWGALRAWQWGVSRLIDYFEQHPDSGVDPKLVGIEGLSRYGKAAIVTAAFDPRVAVALVGSSGEGGVKLHRHIFGEAVENLTGGEYYWMAGNFIKYGASQATFGAKTAADLPVDSHQLIALCAPRPCFISYGVIEHGDPQWVDAHGSFMAGVLAGPVYRLLGKEDLGTPGDYLTDPMPPVNTLIGGELAWRQHDGGHDVTPNWPTFFEWVSRYIKAPPVAAHTSTDTKWTPESAPKAPTAADPIERTDDNSRTAHQQLLAKAKAGGIDLYFLGDSITRRWGTSDAQYKPMLENWTKNFYGWSASNFGWGGDTTQNILWRVANGELDGVNPKVIVILAGTNNLGGPVRGEEQVADVAGGVEAIVKACREKAPNAKIVLTAIFPRNDRMELAPVIDQINARLAKLADGQTVRFLNVNDKLADASGKLLPGMMGDGLHPSVQGYQVWADGLKPLLTELLGPPATTDHAPPPTGDPSAAMR